MQLEFRNPRTPAEISARDALLQLALRPPNAPFLIRDEYPLVLASQHLHTSYCAFHNHQVVAHANLVVKNFNSSITGHSHASPIGLVGNVASAPEWRGKGITTKLINFLQEQAAQHQAQALILWSDLLQFYQKLGFRSCSSELRLHFTAQNLAKYKTAAPDFVVTSADSLSNDQLFKLIQSRPQVSPSVVRAIDDFRALLRIPSTYLLIRAKAGQLDWQDPHFMIMGKGYDMQGVVHEWGGTHPEYIAQGLAQILFAIDFPEIILLAPTNLDQSLSAYFITLGARCETHAMALGKSLVPQDGNGKILENIFVWGLDSI